MNLKPKNHNLQRGQSLIEIMVAVAVGGILVSSAVVLLVVSTRIGRENRFIQAASFLSQELLDKAAVFADREWYCSSVPTCGIYTLQKGSANRYSLVGPAGGPFTAALGVETLILDNVIYTRSFFVENVVRDRCGVGNISGALPTACGATFGTAGFAEDPSTQKITVVTNWPQGGEARVARYVTRNRNELFHQTDWTGGTGQATFSQGPTGVSSVNDRFVSHTCIDFSSMPGSIKIDYPCP